MIREPATSPMASASRSRAASDRAEPDSRLIRMRASAVRIHALLRKELRQLFRDPKTKRIIFISPILQLMLFGYAVTTDVHNVDTFLIDRDRTPESRALVDAIVAGGYFRIVDRSDRSADMAAALDAGHATIGLEIPTGFAVDLAAARSPAVQVLVDGTNSNTGTVAQGYITRIVQDFGADWTRRKAGTPDGGIDLRVRAWYNPGLASRVYNVPAVIGALLLLMSLLLTALAVVRERELGTLEQLMVSPLTPGELMLGKTIPVAIIAFIDLALICTVAILWFDIPFRGTVPALVLASLLYILASLGIGLFISTISHTQQEAFMSMFLILLPALILSGFLYPIHTMPEFFQLLTLLNPVRYFLEIVRAMFLKGSGIADLWPQYLVIATMAAAVLRLATWRFNRTIG
jgi:ABC-2 type transport system permease protein